LTSIHDFSIYFLINARKRPNEATAECELEQLTD